MHLVPITLRECLTLQVVSNVSPSAVFDVVVDGALLVPLHRRLSAPSSRDALATAPVPTWIALGKLNLAQSSASLSARTSFRKKGMAKRANVTNIPIPYRRRGASAVSDEDNDRRKL